MSWLSVSFVGLVNLNLGLGPSDILRLGASSAGGVPSNATTTQFSTLYTSFLLILVGGVILVAGSVIAILYRLRGGIIMLLGSLFGLAGGLTAPFYFPYSGGLILSGPSWGLAVAFLGSFVVLSGIWVEEPEATTARESPVENDEL